MTSQVKGILHELVQCPKCGYGWEYRGIKSKIVCRNCLVTFPVRSKLSELQFLLYKWKNGLLKESDKKELITRLESDAKKRWKKDQWGSCVEYGLIYQLKREIRK